MGCDFQPEGDGPPIVTFSTGGQRESKAGRGRFDLISPHALFALARVLEDGGKRRGERNWEKGLPLHSFIDSALRHITQLLQGDTSEDHAAHALWNLHAYIHTRECIAEGSLPTSLNTLPRWHYGPASKEAQFVEWLEGGPVGILETYEHFRSLGWTEDEILSVRHDLTGAGRIDFHEDWAYTLIPPVPHPAILPFPGSGGDNA